eukprot:TRINITY_DN6272_c0_g1_i2.p1 TRINITY_DN6272_c0_g1~~TRINITY_DN6272_c0_g1_i2.p1  ORF type:complete len:216 (-),score=20.90 TRINITY_DN6272_c0_g1_i2:10-657(-)
MNSHISDVVEVSEWNQLDDGVCLLVLVERLSGQSLGKYHKKCPGSIHKLENIDKVLTFLKKEGVSLVNIGAEDIEQCNSKIILGLLWKIIQKYQIEGPRDQAPGLSRPTSSVPRAPTMAGKGTDVKTGTEEAGLENSMLKWIIEQTKSYGIAAPSSLRNCWKDGRLLAALVDSLAPKSLDMKTLPTDPLQVLDAAKIGRAVQQECRDRSRMPSSA